MRAVQIIRVQPEPMLAEADVPVPAPRDGEVLIRVHAAGVTPSELLWSPTTQNKDGSPRNRAIPGHEFSGVVAALGKEIKDFSIGDEVFGMNDWFVDGATAFANLPYLGASSYETLAAGAHTVTVETVATPGAVIASAQPTFAPATDTTVVLTGPPGAQSAVVLADTNLPATAGSARIRFVNVAANTGPVDVYINFAQRVAAIPSNAASGYLELPENTYAITFDLAGTTTVLLNLPAVEVDAGGTYTLYLAGNPGALTGLLTHDD